MSKRSLSKTLGLVFLFGLTSVFAAILVVGIVISKMFDHYNEVSSQKLTILNQGTRLKNSCYYRYKDRLYVIEQYPNSDLVDYKLINGVSLNTFKALAGFDCVGYDSSGGTLYIGYVPFEGVEIDTFKKVQINKLGYSFFGDKRRLYLVKGYPTDMLFSEPDPKVLDSENIYTVKVAVDNGILILSNYVYFNGVLLEGINPNSVKYEQFPDGSKTFVVYDNTSKTVFCNHVKVPLNIDNLAFYRYTYVDRNEKSYNKILLGDGSNFFTDKCLDARDFDWFKLGGQLTLIKYIR